MQFITCSLATLALAGLAAAQTPKVQMTSAVAPGNVNLRVNGTPNFGYAVFFAPTEQLTDLGGGLVFLIDPVYSIANGLFLTGTVPASGVANLPFTLDATWTGVNLSYQGITFDASTIQISNLGRVSLMASNTIAPAIGLPASFSILGDLFPTSDGTLLSIGGAGPVVESYDPILQASNPVGAMTAGGYPLSVRAQLLDGRVLIAGGMTAGLTGGTSMSITTTNEAYLYNPADGTTTATNGTLNTARAAGTAVTLNNGKVFIFGGIGTLDLANPTSLLTGLLASSELFDPATGLFTNGPTILEGKAFHTATKLNNGNVMLAGGLGLALGTLPFVSNTSYTYVASSNTISPLPASFTGGRMMHTAVKLPDGKVEISGGLTADLTGVLQSGDLTQITLGTIATTAVFNPSSFFSPWSAGPPMIESRALHASAVIPGTSKVFVAGGLSGNINIASLFTGNLGGLVLPSSTANTELIQGSTVTQGPAMSAARVGGNIAVSPMDGRFVLFGGGPLAPELYQP